MEGLNYIKGRDDPIALPEDEYPEWLWKCLEAKVKEGDGDSAEGDMYGMYSSLRILLP
jgi:large subunit ribosomal protein L54